MKNLNDNYLESVKNKEVYINAADKSELMVIVAELGAKSLRVFIYDLSFHLAANIRKAMKVGGEIPAFTIDKKFVRAGSINVNYIYDPDVEYFLRIAAAKCNTSLTGYLRSAIHLLCEQHRSGESLWINSYPSEPIQITKRKEYVHLLARDL